MEGSSFNKFEACKCLLVQVALLVMTSGQEDGDGEFLSNRASVFL